MHKTFRLLIAIIGLSTSPAAFSVGPNDKPSPDEVNIIRKAGEVQEAVKMKKSWWSSCFGGVEPKAQPLPVYKDVKTFQELVESFREEDLCTANREDVRRMALQVLGAPKDQIETLIARLH